MAPVSPDPVFDLPHPFLHARVVRADEIDEYNHVNNTHYVRWLDEAAWGHSTALGLPVEACVALDRGMAVVRTVIVYRRPAFLEEAVTVATWLLPSSSRMRVRRRFQIIRDADAQTLVRAEVDYACIELSTGRPARWPPEFHASYDILPDVSAAMDQLEAL
jgi:acyl-CoA thioester hydrolase